MKIGTKSLLFGVHQFIIHPICVAIAWWKLYGFPNKIQYWVAFIVHDWGYWGKANMDGKEGEEHPELGARIMHKLFDKWFINICGNKYQTKIWYNFTLYHSRFYAKANNHPISKLCIADKYAFTIPPKWLYILLGTLSREIYEYMHKGRSSLYFHSKSAWYDYIYAFIINWVKENNKF
jgi:hypothetical protein